MIESKFIIPWKFKWNKIINIYNFVPFKFPRDNEFAFYHYILIPTITTHMLSSRQRLGPYGEHYPMYPQHQNIIQSVLFQCSYYE